MATSGRGPSRVRLDEGGGCAEAMGEATQVEGEGNSHALVPFLHDYRDSGALGVGEQALPMSTVLDRQVLVAAGDSLLVDETRRDRPKRTGGSIRPNDRLDTKQKVDRKQERSRRNSRMLQELPRFRTDMTEGKGSKVCWAIKDKRRALHLAR